eukprot:IDg21726t1
MYSLAEGHWPGGKTANEGRFQQVDLISGCWKYKERVRWAFGCVKRKLKEQYVLCPADMRVAINESLCLQRLSRHQRLSG